MECMNDVLEKNSKETLIEQYESLFVYNKIVFLR